MGLVKQISTGYLYGLTLAAAAAALFASSAGAQAQQADRGEQIMNATCSGCHDLRTIQTAAKSADEWRQTIDTMIANGAEIKSDADKAVLVEYLAANHPPMPDGRGKDIVLNICTMCHDLGRIRNGPRSPEQWEETLNSMLNEGAPLSDADFPVVLAYLSKNFAQ